MNDSKSTTYQFWTTEEENLLRSLAGKMSFQEMSAQGLISKTPMALQRKATKMGLISGFRATKHSHDKEFWANPNMQNSYWAGFVAADGNLHTKKKCLSVQLHSKELHHLERLKRDVNFTGDLKFYDGYPILSVCGCSKWYEDLARVWSITPAKTFTLEPPHLTDDELIKAYIVGFIDGDGWISYKPGNRRIRVGIVNASDRILEWLTLHIDRLFPHTEKVGKNPPRPLSIYYYKGNYKMIHLDGLRGIRIMNALKDLPVPKLARKWADPRLLAQIESDKAKYPQLFVDKKFDPV